MTATEARETYYKAVTDKILTSIFTKIEQLAKRCQSICYLNFHEGCLKDVDHDSTTTRYIVSKLEELGFKVEVYEVSRSFKMKISWEE